MQEITLVGRIGKRDAAIFETANGNKFIAFSLAADGRVKGKTVTSWYDIISFDVTKYERMLPYMTSGSTMIVVGELYAEIEKGTDNIARCRRSVTADVIKFGPSSRNNSGSTIDENTVIAKTSGESTVSTRGTSTPRATNTILEDIPMGTIPTMPTPAAVSPIPPTPLAVDNASAIDDLPF